MDIDIESLKKLSPKMKALIVLVVCILLGYFYYMFFFQAILTKQTKLDEKLMKMQHQIAEKEKVVAQLDKYLREIKALQESFKVALLKLPNSREIAGLLASVVKSGEEAKVSFLLFEPKPPPVKPPQTKKAPKPPKGQPAKSAEPEKFYDEIPIKVQLVGSFHNTVSFFAKISKLSRIINIEDITMGDAQDVKGKGWVIKTSCMLRTYMFVDKKT